MIQKHILFVCLGNICRSPTAEGVFQKLVEESGLSSKIEIDSAGTGAYHEGERADPRMRQHASAKGYQLNSIARQVRYPEDYEKFDVIFAMDHSNLENLRNLDRTGEFQEKIQLITDYCQSLPAEEVPDPYYGGDAGFVEVIEILEDALGNYLTELKAEL